MGGIELALLSVIAPNFFLMAASVMVKGQSSNETRQSDSKELEERAGVA